MIKQSTIRFLFLMIYFSNFWNTFIANYYLNLSLYQNVNQIFFYVIMTVLKIICPTLSGFIIDHVQFNLNILFIGQWLTIVSYIYFLANIYQEIDDYIYFAIGFQILGQQLQIIIILTMISKHFNENEIPLQIAKFYQFECGAIFTVQENRLKYEKNIQLILSMIPFIILISLAICIYKSFSIFRFDIYQKIPELQYIPIKSRSNLLQAMKDVCKTDVILIAISATSVMSIIQIWQQYQLDYCFDEYKINNPQEIWIIFVAFAISEFPIFISVFIAYRLGKKIKNEIDALQYLTTATSSSLVYFILSTLQLICYKSLFSLRLFITILTITMQQYNQTILSVNLNIIIQDIKYYINWYSKKQLTIFGIIIWNSIYVYKHISNMGHQCFKQIQIKIVTILQNFINIKFMKKWQLYMDLQFVIQFQVQLQQKCYNLQPQ
ncbi:unnamed protein product [Paramecium pentaurelia]|uniref:Uncharacterized protein n=1 Tax=Paramecium pentaurelia TaxID=43138 RepID=A0A8S1WPW4_9CILI|nr:unnamed protein product [Paramecium pentaurelia]